MSEIEELNCLKNLWDERFVTLILQLIPYQRLELVKSLITFSDSIFVNNTRDFSIYFLLIKSNDWSPFIFLLSLNSTLGISLLSLKQFRVRLHLLCQYSYSVPLILFVGPHRFPTTTVTVFSSSDSLPIPVLFSVS